MRSARRCGSWQGWAWSVYREALELFGRKQKYHPSFHQEKNKKFLFYNQVFDNVFRANFVALPLWTLWEAADWWAAANHLVPTVRFAENPVWFVSLFLLTTTASGSTEPNPSRPKEPPTSHGYRKNFNPRAGVGIPKLG